MSKENAKKFFDEVNKDDVLKRDLFDTTASQWLALAKKRNMEMSAEELADELIGNIRQVVNAELDEGSLDAVTGGAGAISPTGGAVAIKVQPQLFRRVDQNQINIAKLKNAGRW